MSQVGEKFLKKYANKKKPRELTAADTDVTTVFSNGGAAARFHNVLGPFLRVSPVKFLKRSRSILPKINRPQRPSEPLFVEKRIRIWLDMYVCISLRLRRSFEAG